MPSRADDTGLTISYIPVTLVLILTFQFFHICKFGSLVNDSAVKLILIRLICVINPAVPALLA